MVQTKALSFSLSHYILQFGVVFLMSEEDNPPLNVTNLVEHFYRHIIFRKLVFVLANGLYMCNHPGSLSTL